MVEIYKLNLLCIICFIDNIHSLVNLLTPIHTLKEFEYKVSSEILLKSPYMPSKIKHCLTLKEKIILPMYDALHAEHVSAEKSSPKKFAGESN